MTNMSKHRSAAGVVAFEGSIYALGGHDGLSIFDLVGHCLFHFSDCSEFTDFIMPHDIKTSFIRFSLGGTL